MEISLLALIGIGLGAMFFGYFFGLFEGRGQGYSKRKKEEMSDPSLRPVVQAAPAPPAAAPQVMTPVAANDHALLRLSLDGREQPCLDMDGEPIDTNRMEPQQRKRLIDLMVMMRPWIEAGPIATARPQQPQAEFASPSGIGATGQRPTVPPFDTQPVTTSVPARTTGPLRNPPAPPEPSSAPTTMVGQIDAILQTKLMGTPLASRGIRLVESAQGGAMVVVGLNRYAGVGDVPDPEVQAAIRTAIAEWENRYTPG
jgi:hypothetical protein